MNITLNDKERMAIFIVLSGTIWGGSEETMLAQLELLEKLDLEKFDALAGGDVKEADFSADQVEYPSISVATLAHLRKVLCGMGQTYAFGRHSARVLKRLAASAVPNGG